MTTITLPDDVPVDQALRCAVEYGLTYDHKARALRQVYERGRSER